MPQVPIHIEAKMGEIADAMRVKKFSHVPILDDHGRLLGVFNEAAIFDCFCSDEIIDASRDLPVSTILKLYRLDANHTETFAFVRPTATESDLVNTFTKIEGPFKRIGALFVTPSGKRTEPITGMITPWDVLASQGEK